MTSFAIPTAIAGKPAPTGVEYNRQKQIGSKATLRASPLPQFESRFTRQNQAGLKAAIAGKPAPTTK
nr:hypothetical protein [uncultured Pseudomonas sp.]